MVPLVRRFAPCSATIGLLLVALVLPIVASTYTVNNTADLPDADPADGVCRTANGNCTLRAAISATLSPANYTAILRGKNNTTGNALVEVYALN